MTGGAGAVAAALMRQIDSVVQRRIQYCIAAARPNDKPFWLEGERDLAACRFASASHFSFTQQFLFTLQYTLPGSTRSRSDAVAYPGAMLHSVIAQNLFVIRVKPV